MRDDEYAEYADDFGKLLFGERDNRRDDQHDDQHGYGWKDVEHHPHFLLEPGTDKQSSDDGHEHNFDDAQKHGPGIYGQVRAAQQFDEQRGKFTATCSQCDDTHGSVMNEYYLLDTEEDMDYTVDSGFDSDNNDGDG